MADTRCDRCGTKPFDARDLTLVLLPDRGPAGIQRDLCWPCANALLKWLEDGGSGWLS